MSEAITQAAAYDLIDRFLRNNLYDDDYAKYSEALEAISQPEPSPQPAVPVVSDEQIDAVSLDQWGPHHGAPLAAHRAFARAILALRPAVEPMTPFTPSQRMRLWQNTEKGKSATSLGAFERICRTVEAAHRIGITAKAEDAHQPTKEAEKAEKTP